MKVFHLGLGDGWSLRVAADSDVGCVRENNEDSLGVFPDPGDTGRGHVLMVADGMGGAAAGEVASGIAVDIVPRHFFDASGDPGEDLADAFQAANDRVLHDASTNHELQGMGTTCTVANVRGLELVVAHIGDSRLYLLDGSSLTLLTVDHTLGTEMENARHGSMGPVPREAHNILTRCIGVDEGTRVDVFTAQGAPQPGDTLLLCSDGLTGMVDEEDVEAALRRAEDPSAAVQELIEAAREEGGMDNITVIVARYEKD